ncbi:DUF3466 family protein [Colwelliaceae bacterium BS250]
MKNLIKTALTLSITSALFAQAAFAATYEVIDLGLVDTVKHTYGVEKNPNGQAIISGVSGYNFPVQFQYLDEDDFDDIVRYAEIYHDQIFELTDIQDEDALRAGTPVPNDLQWAINWLGGTKRGDTRYQKISDTFVFLTDGVTSIPLTIFDQIIPGTSDYTRSTAEIPKGITNDGWSFGSSSAPYMPLPPHTDDDDDTYVHWIPHDSTGDPINGFATRGWVSFDGTSIIEVTPLEASYGGLSAVNDINANRVAVGTSSVSLNPQILEDMLDDDDRGCNDPDYVGDGENVSYEVCIFSYKARLFFSNAVKWSVNDDGSGVVATDLGTGIINPDPEDERPFTSAATGINDSGVIVGYSNFWWDYDETPSRTERVGSFAAVFKDDQVIDFTDRDDYFESRALDIANTGLFTGYMYAFINGKARTKFFYANATDDVITPIFPEDFFKGSASTGFAINETGFIVGEGEVETFNDNGSTPRRRHGFLYDINTDTFSDINSFLTCESQYTVVEARDINDANEILATAFVKQDKRNAVGEVIVIDGETITEDVLRAVYLVPIEGEIEDCSEIEEKTERKGASFGVFAFLSLIPLMLFRRRKFI